MDTDVVGSPAASSMRSSVGSFGDACDNALVGTIVGLYKTELSRQGTPGAASRPLRLQHSHGSTGSNIVDYLSRSTTCLRLSWNWDAIANSRGRTFAA